MYENLATAVSLLDTYTRSIADLRAMVPAVQQGAAAKIVVAGVPNAVQLPASLVVAGLNSEITRLTGLASALTNKLNAASTAIGSI